MRKSFTELQLGSAARSEDIPRRSQDVFTRTTEREKKMDEWMALPVPVRAKRSWTGAIRPKTQAKGSCRPGLGVQMGLFADRVL